MEVINVNDHFHLTVEMVRLEFRTYRYVENSFYYELEEVQEEATI